MISVEALLFNGVIVSSIIAIGIFIFKYADRFVFGKQQSKPGVEHE